MAQIGSILARVNLKQRSCLPCALSMSIGGSAVSPWLATAGSSEAMRDRRTLAVVEPDLELALGRRWLVQRNLLRILADLEVEGNLADRPRGST